MRTTTYLIETDGSNTPIPALSRADVVELNPIDATTAKAVVRGSRPAGFEHDLRTDKHVVSYEATDIDYDYPAIEAALMRLGATAEEADALTEILHVEGWGGAEEDGSCVDIEDSVLRGMIGWLRSERPVHEVSR